MNKVLRKGKQMLDKKYLTKQNNVISEAYYKRDDIISEKDNIINVSKENLIEYCIKNGCIIAVFAILSQLKLWSFIQSDHDVFIFQLLFQSLLLVIPLIFLFLSFSNSNIAKLNMKFNSDKFVDILFITFAGTVIYVLCFGSFNVLYCMAHDIVNRDDFLNVFTRNSLYLTFIGCVFYFFNFFKIKKGLFSEKNLLDKKEKLEKEEEKINLFIDETENNMIKYLKNNIKSSKNADYLLFMNEDNQLMNLRDEISVSIEYYANNQGFESYKELKREELLNQEEEMIYNY